MKNQNRTIILIAIVMLLVVSCSKDAENIPPTCQIGILQNNMEILKGTPVSFPVYAEDEDGTISWVAVTLNGDGFDTATVAPYEFSWSTLDAPTGTHTFIAEAHNANGEVAAATLQLKVITSGDPVVPCPEAITISYEGQTYNTIKVGDQCWLKENLKVSTENSSFYENNPDNGNTYGQLYDWEDAMIACPPGWKLPAYDDWCTLVQHTDASAFCQPDTEVGTDAGFKLKSNGGWLKGQGGSDQFGFRAFPAGLKDAAGSFSGLGSQTGFWSSTEGAAGNAGYWNINSETTRIVTNQAPKTTSYSVRCIKE